MSSCTTCRHVMSGEAEGLIWDLARGALRVASVPYALGSGLAEIVRQGQGGARVDVPVISVGNITCGGTGKTPLVSLLVRQLVERGRRPVVLSRGYKAAADGANDEFRVLERHHPGVLHLQGKDRVRLARRVADARLGDVIVLDDGFQHQRLHRDLNVCALDATNPFGYGAVLPRGLLREPLGGLYRARPVVITRAELVTSERLDAMRAEVLRHNAYAKIVVSEMRFTGLADMEGRPAGSVESLRGKTVVLLSGIGNPGAFERGVRALGARVAHHVERSDHHAWTQDDVRTAARTARELSADVVLTTEKDAVKLATLDWPEGAPPASSLTVEVELTDGADVWDALLAEVLKAR